jgi:hypothetical protein
MARSPDDIGTPVPFGAHRRVRPELSRMEVQGVPKVEKEADVERERQPVRRFHLVGRRERLEIGPDRIDVGPAHPREICVGEHGVEVLPAMRDAVVNRAIEVGLSPSPYTRLGIRSDVGRIDDSERRSDRARSRKGLAAGVGVARSAITGDREIAAALHRIRTLPPGCNERHGRGISGTPGGDVLRPVIGVRSREADRTPAGICCALRNDGRNLSVGRGRAGRNEAREGNAERDRRNPAPDHDRTRGPGDLTYRFTIASADR